MYITPSFNIYLNERKKSQTCTFGLYNEKSKFYFIKSDKQGPKMINQTIFFAGHKLLIQKTIIKISHFHRHPLKGNKRLTSIIHRTIRSTGITSVNYFDNLTKKKNRLIKIQQYV
jgi:hypothetical protein